MVLVVFNISNVCHNSKIMVRNLGGDFVVIFVLLILLVSMCNMGNFMNAHLFIVIMITMMCIPSLY